ncbi:hypothetical protein ACFSQD_04330 [Flavihumibacter stibioxidans]|uniref:Uncharacterized protein n=1 Tax=Flavihumibacter stibioxidans TaxID=1834163 RepID=A0ABR7M4S6_9BACT|nr:hypothetical protein [Flavihumibacter stibioxidans]MBC6489534.1 hypothetical protein [Flavihumibacter stibioxidans]
MKEISSEILLKPFITVVLSLVFSSAMVAQEHTIVKILNRELKKEADQLVVQPYAISEKKILSVEIKTSLYDGAGYQVEKQEVVLSEIKSVGKDVNIIFEAEPEAVITTRTIFKAGKNVQTSVQRGNFFSPAFRVNSKMNGLAMSY